MQIVRGGSAWHVTDKGSACARPARFSDICVLIPTRTSLADMDAVPTSHAMAKAAGKPHYVLFSDVDVSGAKRDVKEAAAGFVAVGEDVAADVDDRHRVFA